MCFATAAVVAGVAGAGFKVFGDISGGEAAANAANYQAAVASNNAIIAEQNAVRATEAGYVSAQNQSLKGAAVGAKVKVAQASNGVDVNRGSAVNVQAGEREVNQLDTETVFQNDQLKAYGYRVQKGNFQSEAELDRMKADSDEKAGYLKAGGDLLSSVSSLGGKWGSGGGISPTGTATENFNSGNPIY